VIPDKATQAVLNQK